MTTVTLSDESWILVYDFLKTCDKIYTKNEKDLRNFVESVLYITRSGVQWRLLPAHFGKWNSIYRRFGRWAKKGVWKDMFLYFSADKDLEYIMIDASIMQAHACSAGAKKGAIRLLEIAKVDTLPNCMRR